MARSLSFANLLLDEVKAGLIHVVDRAGSTCCELLHVTHFCRRQGKWRGFKSPSRHLNFGADLAYGACMILAQPRTKRRNPGKAISF